MVSLEYDILNVQYVWLTDPPFACRSVDASKDVTESLAYHLGGR